MLKITQNTVTELLQSPPGKPKTFHSLKVRSPVQSVPFISVSLLQSCAWLIKQVICFQVTKYKPNFLITSNIFSDVDRISPFIMCNIPSCTMNIPRSPQEESDRGVCVFGFITRVLHKLCRLLLALKLQNSKSQNKCNKLPLYFLQPTFETLVSATYKTSTLFSIYNHCTSLIYTQTMRQSRRFQQILGKITRPWKRLSAKVL